MTKIRHYIKVIALILCFTLQINIAKAAWPPLNGNGSYSTPWQITNYNELKDLADYVNAGNGPATAGEYYILTTDIAFPAAGLQGWDPIGNNAIPTAIFQGNFNGNSKVISNIAINRSTSYIGLFGYVENAYIHDIGIASCQITGNQNVGGLIGRADNSWIENCYVSDNIVTGSSIVGGLVGYSFSSAIYDSYAGCNVNGDISVGGLIGINEGIIQKCYANGNVTADIYHGGGFVGANNRYIVDCYATGNVTGTGTYMGGFVGASGNGPIKYCYATGNVISTATGDYIGGFVGLNRSASTINNCVAANNTIIGGFSYVNYFAGKNEGNMSKNYANNGMVISPNPNGYQGTLVQMATLMSFIFYNTGSNWSSAPWSIDTNDDPLKNWKICDGISLPFLQWEGIQCNPIDPCDVFQDGSINFPYLICTVQDLVDLANLVNYGGGNSTAGKYWKVMNDLDLSVVANWNPIGGGSCAISYHFQGNFDGNGKVISNLTISRGTTDFIGLFGIITNAEIKNLGIEDCIITGKREVGSLVGHSESSVINNCYSIGSVTGVGDCIGGLIGRISSASCFGGLGWKIYPNSSIISNSYSICSVSGTSSVGGLLGDVYDDCLIEKCYASGNVTGTISYIGGLIGFFSGINFSSITDCYATGDVNVIGSIGNYCTIIGGLMGSSSSSNITNCYSIGNVSVRGLSILNVYIGGLVGINASSISNCYTTSNIDLWTSSSNIGGFVGENCLNTPILYCYATGDITGNGGNNFGGVAGCSRGILRNCVAANSTVSGASSNINRVIGLNYGVVDNNYYFDNMVITPNGGYSGFPETMAKLKSFRFYNDDTNNTWYINKQWSISDVSDPYKIWQICDTKSLPFFQWQGLNCSKSLLQEDDNEEYHFSEQKTTSAFYIFPSPTSNTITIYSDSNFQTIEIVDILGKIVHFQTNNGNNITLDVSHFSTGVYFVRIINEEGFKVQKFVKK